MIQKDSILLHLQQRQQQQGVAGQTELIGSPSSWEVEHLSH
jgi:hypothetical protein